MFKLILKLSLACYFVYVVYGFTDGAVNWAADIKDKRNTAIESVYEN